MLILVVDVVQYSTNIYVVSGPERYIYKSYVVMM